MPLLTLDEAKQQLNISGSGQDVELQAYIDSLTAVIEHLVGPVENRTVTQTVEGGAVLCLLHTPVVSVESLMPLLPGGVEVDAAAVVVDGPSGVLRRLDGGRFTGGPWTAVYTAGRGEVPATVNLAARMLLQHLWRTQNGGRGPVLGGDDMAAQVPGFGYAIPTRVLELLAPYRLLPGVA